MNAELLEGDAAHAWLGDERARDEWERLASRCAWATGFQTSEYARIWLSAYSGLFEPVVVTARDGGDLVGLLVLANDRATGSLSAIGGSQSEYQAWLCERGVSAPFLEAALARLGSRFPRGRVRLHYFPDAEEASAVDRSGLSDHVLSKEHRRPLLRIGDGSGIARSLQKKSNKSKINRLRRRGELALHVLTSRSELEECIDAIAAIYDLRQSAVNRTAPFFEDPRKRGFLLDLMDAGLLHAATLTVGGEIVAALLSVPDRDALAVGVFAISARMASDSPGKLLLLLLASELVETGVDRIDLTPGGAWKERFANEIDTVEELVLFFDPRDAAAARRKLQATAVAKRSLARVGVTPNRARSWAAAVSPGSVLTRLGKTWATRELLLHEVELAAVEDEAHVESGSTNAVTAVYPPGDDEAAFHDLMREIFERLQSEWQSVVTSTGRTLERLVWYVNVEGREALVVDDIEVPLTGATWLIDLTAHGRFGLLSAPTREDVARCLFAIAREGAPCRVVALSSPSDDPADAALRANGFHHTARLTTTGSLGGERRASESH